MINADIRVKLYVDHIVLTVKEIEVSKFFTQQYLVTQTTRTGIN